MSKQIDERVVEMRFDNRQFEKNIQTSMSTLDKLKQSLNFKGATKSLENIDTAAKKVDMSTLGRSVEAVQAKFSALSVMGVTALANITNSAVNAGKRIVSALTIDPIKTGFQEYETQINAVQTILANTESKGSTLQDVNNALAQLNTYADKTIYNFTEMTRNIGTFTAAGVDLKTSVSAIKGIANLAAVSGSSSQQASTAMYQLSQALASGTVKLMDWNSVVNAGMGGQVFQDSLKETARVHGVAIDDMIEKEGSFRETLKDGWLTSEILTETLSKFTGDLSEQQLKSMGYTDEQIKGIIKMGETANDAATKVKTFTQLFDTLKEAAQSGWTKSWELLIGDFGEAKELLTDISNLIGGIIGGSADKRNAMLMGGLSTGWKQLLNEGIHDAAGFEEMVTSVAKSHGVDIASMINDETSFQDALKQTLKDGTLTSDTLGESISKFTEKVGKMSEAELENAGYTAEQIEKLKELDAKVKDGSISMEKFAELIVRPSGRELLIESLWNVLNGLKSILGPIKQAFEEIFPSMTGEQLYGLIEKLKELTSKFKLSEEQAEKLKSTFKGLFSVVDIVVTVVKEVASGAVKLLGSLLGLGDGVLSITGSLGDWVSSLRNVIKESGVIGTVIGGVTSVLQKFINTVTKKFVTPGVDGFLSVMQKIFDVVVSAGGKIIDFLSSIGSGIANAFRSGDVNTALDTLNTGLFGGILLAIKKFMGSATDALEDLGGIRGILDGVKGCLEAWQKDLKSNVLLKIASAIGILALSILLISSIDPAKLAASLGAITVLFADLIGAMKLFDMIGGSFKGMTKATIGMIGMSIAVLILASALKKISDLKWEELGKGLVGITVLMGVLIGAAKLMSMGGKTVVKGAGQLILFAAAIKILASAVKDISGMKWEELGKGLAGVAGLMLAVAGFSKLMGNTKNLLSMGVSMMLLGAAMKTFASAIKDISDMKWEELGKGLAGMAGALISIALALRIMPKNMISTGAGLLIVSSALVVLSSVLEKMSGMSWTEVGKGLATLGGSLLILAAALLLMKGTLSGSAALLVATVSLAILTPILMALGSMKWESIVRGLVALAGAFVVIGVAGYVLGPIAPAILALAGAIALIGVGCLAAGVGLIAAAAGITALATAVAAGATAIVAGIAAIVLGIISLAGDIIVGLCTAIVNSASALYEAIKTLLVIIIDVVVECVPMIAEALAQLFVKGLELLATYAPQIVEGLYQFLINVFDTVAENAPRLAESLANMFKSIFQSVIDAFGSEDMMSLLVEGLKGVGVLAAMMAALNGIAILTPGAMAGVLGIVAVLAEIGAIAQIPGLTWLIGEGAGLMQNIGSAIGNFVGGLVGGLAEGIMSSLPQIASDLSLFMLNLQPFIVGAAGLDPSMLEGVQALAGVILALTASNILDGLTKWFTGGTSLVDFGKQIAEFGPYIKQFSDSVADISPEAVTAAANAGKMLAEMASALPNSGGVAGWFAGENDMEDFGSQLKGFGEAIADFSAAVDGKVNAGAIEIAVNAGKSLAGMAEAMPNSGGLLGDIVGDNDMSTVGPQLVTFGKSLADFSTAVDGKINSDAVAAAANAGTTLAAMAESMPNSGGWLGDIVGNNDMNVVGPQLVSFGKALADFSTAVSGKLTGFETAISGIKKLTAMLADIGKINVSNISSLKTALKELGSVSVDGFINSFKGASESASTTVSNFITSVKTAITNGRGPITQAFSNVGKAAIINGFVNAFSSASNNAKSAVTTFINSIKTQATNSQTTVYQAFYKVGKYAMQGFANGITANKYLAIAAAANAGREADIAARNAIGVESPSKSFMEIGAYAVAGLAIGITSNLGVANKAGENLGSTLLTATQKNLKINSPSLVFKDEVGRYIVQGIAEGIAEETSAEKAAREKAEKIAQVIKDVFEEAIRNITHDIDVHNTEFDIWSAYEGRNASEAEKTKKQLAFLYDNKTKYEEAAFLAMSKYYDLLSHEAELGKDADAIIDSAYKEWREAELNKQKNLAEIAELTEVTNEDIINLSESKISARNSMGYDAITDEKRDADNLTNLDEIIKVRKSELEEAEALANAFIQNGEQWTKAGMLAQEAYWNALQAFSDAEQEREEYANSIKDRELARIDGKINVLNSEIDYRNSLDSDEISDSFRDKQNLEDLNKILDYTSKQVEIIEAKYNELCEEGLETTEEGIAAREELVDALQKQEDAEDAVWDQILSMSDKAKRKCEEAISRSQTELDLWEELYGDKASDEERDTKYLEHYNNAWAEKTAIAMQSKQDYLDAVEQYGKKSEEAVALWDVWQNALVDEAKAKNQVTDYIKDAQNRENEQLQELYDITKSNADLRYQIWEKTAGRDVTNVEKDAKKLDILNQQIASQTASVALATKLYNEVVAEFGKDSNEALSAYNDYLNECLELANLNSEILDIEERNAKRQERQRNAKADYLDYMEKYEKYYLDHGMTLEELEKDAMLVSGYDPTKIVNTTISDTVEALDDAKNSQKYSQLLSNFSGLGTSYAISVSEGVTASTPEVITSATTMVSDCIESMKATRPSWIESGTVLMDGFIEGIKSKYSTVIQELTIFGSICISHIKLKRNDWLQAGVHLVNGFIKGIKSRIDEAAQAAAELAYAALEAANEVFDINSPSKAFAKIGEYAAMGLSKGLSDNEYLAANAATNMGERAINNLRNTIKRISEAVNSDIDSQPTIRPVLDLSDVASGTARLNAMVSRAQAISISSDMARKHSEGIQNGADSTTASGNTYQFTQNNYSPKALSRVEIYRQTKNQFSAMKRMVEA